MYNSAKDLYDKMCEVLTNFEGPSTEAERSTVDDLYSMLVDIQNHWELIQGIN